MFLRKSTLWDPQGKVGAKRGTRPRALVTYFIYEEYIAHKGVRYVTLFVFQISVLQDVIICVTIV